LFPIFGALIIEVKILIGKSHTYDMGIEDLNPQSQSHFLPNTCKGRKCQLS